jgi:hypothetical protein
MPGVLRLQLLRNLSYNELIGNREVRRMREVIKYKPINKREFARKAKAIYETIRDEMETNYMGKIVAIDPETGDYFIGDSGIDAGDKAREKYPDKIFFLVRVGSRTYLRRR